MAIKINKIFFVGLGGAGQRHLRVFKRLLGDGTEFSAYRSVSKTPLLNKDFTVDESRSIEQKYGLKSFDSIEKGLDNHPDLIVIATPTSLHFNQAMKAAERGINIFIEKPFSNTLASFNKFNELVLRNKLYFFISFQLRFNPYLMMVKKMISKGTLGNIISAVFNICSYVPQWHPYEDFKKLYACDKRLGGGVLLTETHEIDLCYWYFGLPESVYCDAGNYAQPSLEVEDTAHLTLKYKKFSIQINQCFMQKHVRRDFYISGTKGYVEWNAMDNALLIEDYGTKKKRYFFDKDFSYEQMFFAQAEYFLNKAKRADRENLKTAMASLAIVESAKKSNRTGKNCKVNR